MLANGPSPLALLALLAWSSAAVAQGLANSTLDRSRPAGAVVYTVDSTEISSSGARTLSEVLQARVPGLSIFKSGGVAGQGSTALARGTRSFAVVGEPIVVVDGVRVDAAQDAAILAFGVSISRLDDIAPEDIARIEVLPGAASAGEYGPGAASGAIVITTKRGAERGLHVGSRAQSAVGIVATSFPTNYQLEGIDVASGQPRRCTLGQVGAGQCTPTQLDTWNPLESASPFRVARSVGGAFAVDGGMHGATARLGLSGDRVLGVTSDDDAGRLGVRANVTQQIGQGLRIAGNGGYVQRSAALPPRGGAFLESNVIARGLFGFGVRDSLDGYLPTQLSASVRETARHWAGGASAQWDAFRWMHIAGVYGVDHVLEHDDGTSQQLNFPLQIERARVHQDLASASISARSGDWSIGNPALRTRTIVAYSQLRSMLLAFDSSAIVNSSPPIFAMASMRQTERIAGSSLRQELTWDDRVSVGVGVRWERWSIYGARRPGHFFRSADASWLVGRALGLDSLRVRAAYGEAGNWSPGNAQRITSSGFPLGEDPTQFAPAERVKETELGADFTFTHHAAVSLTAFRSDARDLYDFPGTFNFSISRNLAAIRNLGLELAARLDLVQTHAFEWNAMVRASALHDRVRGLGPLTNVVIADRGVEQVGSRPNGYFASSHTYTDANHDGIIAPSELQVSTQRQVAGSSLPSREASLLSTAAFGHALTLSALFDYRGGQKLSNMNETKRCGQYINCRGVNDRTASLAEQAQAEAQFAGSFIEGASFVKFRELSLRWIVPARAANWMGGAAAITVAGRNLATWTNYHGVDPELNSLPLALPRADLAATPIPREILLRLDVGGGAR